MDGFAATLFTVTSAALMGYSFALLLVVKKKQDGRSHGGIARTLPLFPLLLIFYFAFGDFPVAREAAGILALLVMFYIGYNAIVEERK